MLTNLFQSDKNWGRASVLEVRGGEPAKRFLGFPPAPPPPTLTSGDSLFCLVLFVGLFFWLWMFFLHFCVDLYKYFLWVGFMLWARKGGGMKICKYVLPSGICALLQRICKDEPIQIASEVAKTSNKLQTFVTILLFIYCSHQNI